MSNLNKTQNKVFARRKRIGGYAAVFCNELEAGFACSGLGHGLSFWRKYSNPSESSRKRLAMVVRNLGYRSITTDRGQFSAKIVATENNRNSAATVFVGLGNGR